jgi:uncharacterized protein
MNPRFIDTSFLLALLLSDDQLHEKAIQVQGEIVGPLVTTEYVLVELADALTSEPHRTIAVEAIELLRSTSTVRIIPASTLLMDLGLERFASRADKRWGLTDCISFVVMEQEEISAALTADHHFEQAGFVALLR